MKLEMKLPSELTTVTPLSRKLALILFVLLPIISFWAGMKYQELMEWQKFESTKTTQEKSLITDSTNGLDDKVNSVVFEIQKQIVYQTENEIRTEFGQVDREILSPDGAQYAILVGGYTTSPQLFISDQNKDNLRIVKSAEEIVWSNNSRYIAITSKVADAGSTYFLGVYDTVTGELISMNEKVDKSVITYPNRTSYHNPLWLADDSGITVNYREYSDIPYGETTKEGTITVYMKNKDQHDTP